MTFSHITKSRCSITQEVLLPGKTIELDFVVVQRDLVVPVGTQDAWSSTRSHACTPTGWHHLDHLVRRRDHSKYCSWFFQFLL